VIEASSALEFLLVSNNHHTLTAVAGGLEQAGIHFNFAPTSEAGRAYVGRHKVDGIIVDLDVPGAHELILFIRQSGSNRGIAVFACLPRGNASPVAVVPGATALIPQPLTSENVASIVSTARDTLSREQRRFFRYRVDLPVHVRSDGGEQRGMMTTLGEGGMALFTVEPIARSRMIEFAFNLPSGDTIAGKGSVVWANDELLHGVKFVFLRAPAEESLQKWCRQQSSPSED
jgi:hypothetical protein